MRPCWNDADQDAASNRFGISEVARLSGLPFVDFDSDSNAHKGMDLDPCPVAFNSVAIVFWQLPRDSKEARHSPGLLFSKATNQPRLFACPATIMA